MFRRTPTSGRATSHSSSISPGLSIAISSTEISWSGCNVRSASGRPSREFMFPGLRCTAKRDSSSVATASLAVVLPTVPVIPTTRAPHVSRQADATSFIATRVSGEMTAVTSSGRCSGRRSQTTATAPAAVASRTKSFPSRFSPLNAAKRSPGRTVRESGEPPVMGRSVPGTTSYPRSPMVVATKPVVSATFIGPPRSERRRVRPRDRAALHRRGRRRSEQLPAFPSGNPDSGPVSRARGSAGCRPVRSR